MKIAVAKNPLVAVSALLIFLLPVYAGFCEPQEDSSESRPRFDVSGLDLSSDRRAEVESALAKKEYKQAERVLVAEIDQDPKSFRAANLLEFAGGIFFLDGEYLNAAIAWKKAEALVPLSEQSRFTLAMAYVKLGRSQWARPELERLAAAYPRNALYLYWLARLDYDDQRYSEAIRELQRVTTLDPNMTRAYDLLGLCHDYAGRLDQALASFARAVELNRLKTAPSPWPHLDMAISQVEAGQLAQAEANLRAAIKYDPQLAQAQYQLGRVLDKEGKAQEAVQALKASAVLDPKYPEPHYLLGRIYQKLGRAQLAKDEIEKFQELQKASPSRPR